jgi:hypothetical protein
MWKISRPIEIGHVGMVGDATLHTARRATVRSDGTIALLIGVACEQVKIVPINPIALRRGKW